MKLKIIRSTFLEGLKAVQNVVAGKGSLAILQNVLLETHEGDLKLTTTDLDISVISSIPCEIVEEGATTLPVKLLFSTISTAPEGEICIDVDENDVASISAGSAKFRITGLNEKDFPRLPHDDEAFSYDVPAATLKEMIRKTAYAASQDDTRRTLKGVLMSFKDQKLTMVATDGRRLALVESEMEFPVDAERDIVLPAKAVQELQRSLASVEEGVKILIQKSQICFRLSTATIYSKLMDDTYPNYIQVIPTSVAEQITVDRQLLLSALERVKVMRDNANSTRFVFDANCLTVTSAAGDSGSAKDEVPIKYAGETIEIMFNPDYVMDPLKAIDDDEVKIELNSGTQPAVIKCSVPFLYVLMPLRSN